MAQEEIRYTIPNDGQGHLGSEVDIIITYDATKPRNADGSVQAIDAHGTYKTLAADGSVVDSDKITGLLASGSDQFGGDDELFIDQEPYVTGNGISFQIDNKADSNDGNGGVNFYSDGGTSPAAYFEANYNQQGTTDVTETAACFCPGTLILTDRGEVAIETIAIGDHVITAGGRPQPVLWIGRRTYAGRRAAQRLVRPVLIKAGALGTACPRRDLRVSPGHGLLIDDQLIQARLLVNNVSIVQPDAVDMVTYYNIELAEHDILLAEGTPAETFHDNGARSAFENAAEFARLYPDAPARGLPCLPLLDQGFALEAIRGRIDGRAGIAPQVPNQPGPLTGFLDVAGPERACGWAQDRDHPEDPVRLDVLVDGRRVMRIIANLDRADLHAAGLGSGRHAFEVCLPQGCIGAVTVRRTADGAELPLTETALEAHRKTA